MARTKAGEYMEPIELAFYQIGWRECREAAAATNELAAEGLEIAEHEFLGKAAGASLRMAAGLIRALEPGPQTEQGE